MPDGTELCATMPPGRSRCKTPDSGSSSVAVPVLPIQAKLSQSGPDLGEFPQDDTAVLHPDRQPFPVGAPGQVRDRAVFVRKDEEATPSLHVPDADGRGGVIAREPAAVGAHGDVRL